MDITFVRTDGTRDRVYVRRVGASKTSWSFPSYGGALPHDLVHLVVESVFELDGGFWGRVAGGVDPDEVNALAERGGGPEKYAGFGEDPAVRSRDYSR